MIKKVKCFGCTQYTIGKIFCLSLYRGMIWFRIFGWGMNIENRKIHPPLFSERNGYSKPLRIGKYAIKPLKP